MKSLGQMLASCEGLRNTKDITEWENDFLTSVMVRYILAKWDSSVLSAKQVEVIERIYNKHFGGLSEDNLHE